MSHSNAFKGNLAPQAKEILTVQNHQQRSMSRLSLDGSNHCMY